MFKKTAIIAGIGLALSATAQADYDFEVGAQVALGSVDTKIKQSRNSNESNSEDSTIGRIGGRYFFNPVDTSKGPLGEAEFLDHASYFGLNYNYAELDLASGGDADGDHYGADMRYVAEGPGWKLSGVIVDLAYERLEPGDQEIDRYGLGLGYYLTPTTTAVVNYRKTNVNNGGDVDSYKLDLESFFALNNGGIQVRASGGKTVVSGLDDPTVWTLGGTWYLGNNWGIGADFGKDDVSGFETDLAEVNVEWFITESFAVDLAYRTIQPDDFPLIVDNGAGPVRDGKIEAEYDEVALSALYRF
jgi:hypothetical protein